MNCDLPATVSVPVTPLDMAVDYADSVQVRCLNCQAPLELHLPDRDKSDRLLGTCGACGSWYLLDCLAGAMLLLPQSQSLLEPSAEQN